MIRVLLAGASKGHICQKMVDNSYTILFVCPTNRLSHSFEVDARTINNIIFGSISFGDATKFNLNHLMIQNLIS